MEERARLSDVEDLYVASTQGMHKVPLGMVSSVDYALQTENLPDLAGRYRALKDDPEKGEYAQKRIDAIVVAATQMLASMKTPPPPKSNKVLTIAVAIVCACVMSWLAWTVLKAH